MQHLTLRQRKRYRELLDQFDRLKQDPYLLPPLDYEAGKDPELDARYEQAGEAMSVVLEEIHELEQKGRQGN